MPGFGMLGITLSELHISNLNRPQSIRKKVHFFNPLGPEAQSAKNQVTLNQSFQNYALTTRVCNKTVPLQKPLRFDNRVKYFQLLKFDHDQFAIGLVDLDEYPVDLGD